MKKQANTHRFFDLEIRDKLLEILEKKGFTNPTPIQYQVIPGALEGKDIIGIAQTGTGKTLAFGIPLIQNVALHKGQGLVIVPTRELALQVEKALTQIGAPLNLRTAVLIGGESQHRQVKKLKQKPHIVIATPGRLDDLIKQREYDLGKVTVIVLDESDRMLDVGFLPQIKRILTNAPANRQTMLFSATMPKSISDLASKFMRLPLSIEVAPQGTASKNVEQGVFIVRRDDKMKLLESLLADHKRETTLIFSRTKHGARKLAKKIRDMGHTATEIHSNRSQAQRKKALEGFAKGRFRVMVATDIAARGIDVKKISLVINYDLPDNTEDYVHRIGRTGRAGRYGKAISFATVSQKADVKKIETLIRKSLPILTHDDIPQESFSQGKSKPSRKRTKRGKSGHSSRKRRSPRSQRGRSRAKRKRKR